MKSLSNFINESLNIYESSFSEEEIDEILNRWFYLKKGTYKIKGNVVDVNGTVCFQPINPGKMPTKPGERPGEPIYPKVIGGRLIIIEDNPKLDLTDIFTFGKVTGDFKILNCHETPDSTEIPIDLTKIPCPKEVGGKYWISNNKYLKSLVGGPEKVHGEFLCFNNDNLTSLNGCPKEAGSVSLHNLRNVTDLKGITKKINGDLDIGGLSIQDLKNGPNVVKGNYIVNNCPYLKSDNGITKKVDGEIKLNI